MTALAFGNNPLSVRLRRVKPFYTPASLCALLVLAAIASLVSIGFTSEANRPLLYPAIAILWLALLYFSVLWRRDRRLPVFEVGTLCVVATALYGAMPLFGFMALGGQWRVWLTDNRLYFYEFNARELGSFGWRTSVYLLAFVVCYLLVRKDYTARSRPLAPVPGQLVTALAFILAGQYAFKWLMKSLYGLDLDINYNNLSDLASALSHTPLLVLQIALIVLAAVLVVKQALLIVLIRHWRSLQWRFVIVVWLAVEIIGVAVRMGERGDAVRLLLSFAVLYDRFGRPIRMKWAMAAGTALLAAFLVQGLLRAATNELSATNVLIANNEFQSLFSTAFDLFKRKQLGTLRDIPWQIYWSDAYMLIPQQLLPFEKINPADWYLSVMGIHDVGVGFMFGVMSQAVLGFDWAELAVRGAFLGIAFAFFHRWYVKRASNFWATLLYLFITIWSYYTYRATTFWILHFVVYQFLPVFILAKIIQAALSRGVKAARGMVQQRNELRAAQ